MILIYTDTSPARLQYICKFIFEEQFGLSYSFTIDAAGFEAHQGPKINYSSKKTTGYFLEAHALLFENAIRTQQIECSANEGVKYFFQTPGDFHFDIFAASFFLLSRYEEYLPHQADMYGRYAHENSLAFRENFLRMPLINHWLHQFAASLLQHFPQLTIRFPEFKFLPTYDIDMAWSYRHKGVLRNGGGFLKAPSLQRLKVVAGIEKDPYDCYEFLDTLHKMHVLHPLYFFLVAPRNSMYDKNISPYTAAMWTLLRRHAKLYAVGLHPSWRSNESIDLVKKEKKILETATRQQVSASRQHYIKLNLPETFQNLIAAGITDDYSLGYGSINGFRSSTASSHSWYNLATEHATTLRLHPFCFMDANAFFEEKLSADAAAQELQYYFDACKAVQGTFISIFHNNILGTDKIFDGWREMYVRFIAQVQK